MPNRLSEQGQSVVETSLTELAFIFFFILLIFSTLRINSLMSEKSEADEVINTLIQEVENNQELQAQFAQQHAKMRVSLQLSSVDLELPFEGIEETTSNVVRIADIFDIITNTGRDVEGDEIVAEAIVERLEDMARLEEKYGEAGSVIDALDRLLAEDSLDKSLSDYLVDLNSQIIDLRGQNKNMRTRLNSLGNGLVYPPCWADVETGSIEYIYNVTIQENSLVVSRAWPHSREQHVQRSPHIAQALGEYSVNAQFTSATRSLFNESRANNCRHFVRVIDEAVSKDAFKDQLLTVENHFYKYLVP